MLKVPNRAKQPGFTHSGLSKTSELLGGCKEKKGSYGEGDVGKVMCYSGMNFKEMQYQ